MRGTYLITRACLQLVGAHKPSAAIVDVASSAAITVMPSSSAYCISKLAVAFLQQFIACGHVRHGFGRVPNHTGSTV